MRDMHKRDMQQSVHLRQAVRIFDGRCYVYVDMLFISLISNQAQQTTAMGALVSIYI